MKDTRLVHPYKDLSDIPAETTKAYKSIYSISME